MKNRSGSYKKQLISEETLSVNYSYLQKNVSLITSNKELLPYELATLYFILFLRVFHQKNWFQKKSHLKNKVTHQNKFLLELIPMSFEFSDQEKEKLSLVTLKDFYLNFNFRGIPSAVNRTYLHWIEGLWKIELLFYVPTTEELLSLQVQNKRCLTLLLLKEDVSSLFFHHRDPLSFLVHDLVHADHFFGHPDIFKGQLGFYHLLKQSYQFPLVQEALQRDSTFKKEFEYIAADMNGYVIHLLKCLKSVFNQWDRNRQNSENSSFLALLEFWQAPQDVFAAAQKLNTPNYTGQDEDSLILFFESKSNRDQRVDIALNV